MLIGIDASKLSNKRKTGVDYTAYNLIYELKKIDRKNQYLLYTNKPIDKIFYDQENFKERLIPFPKFWNRFRLPLAIIKDKPELFIQLTNNLPPITPQKTIIFLHDFAFKYFPKAYSKYELMLQESAVLNAIRKDAVLIFSSKANLADFEKFYGYTKNKKAIIPLGYNNRIKAVSALNKPKPYILYVGRLEKRKNVEKIISAFEIFKDKTESGLSLLLVGKNGYGADDIKKKINKSKYQKYINIEGYVDDDKLCQLYSNAFCLLYPSLYEGFGYPMLEAMAANTPVISSDIPTLREIGGNAVFYVNPNDEKSIASGIIKLNKDRELKQKLIDAGKLNVKKYSWEYSAKLLFELIKERK